MRVFLIAMFVWAASLTAGVTQSQDIQNVIESQLEAFKADDFTQAFTYASPSIQRVFRDPENFGRMVRGGYPMVWRPAEVRFLELREISDQFFQRVLITSMTGKTHILDYHMIENAGSWKINGVYMVKLPITNT
ncbi:MAG: DUF4864 domain-containing protein [Aestuariivita sp.]|nr:DUF4864 domain-containing protein [Aestuariivita sp.]